MYNRYIPQPDGSFRRNHIPDPPKPKPDPPMPSTPAQIPPPLVRPPEPPVRRPLPPPRPIPPKQKKPPEPVGIGSFLKQLLPKNFDTEDLLIVLLLLLMSGDCRDDQNTALLTLALYLFM
ncbi:MAG: hypothetical protein J6V25_10000 [Oscillospiraceae bacterium]|nr:hypothetical protein [Oscillospiraceae bacterium]